jgi:UDP-N-acetylmuramate--alanine ligase
VQSILPRLEKRHITYGLSAQADYRAEDVEQLEGAMAFNLKVRGAARGRVRLNMIGRHNVANALAALAVAEEVGVPFDVAAHALATFEGVGRRFEKKGMAGDVLVVDDYGHHPAEIHATLRAARDAYQRRLVVAFQPHRYTRTRDLFDDFTKAFNQADVLLLADIYAASEAPIEGISAEKLALAIRAHGHKSVHYVGPVTEMATELAKIVEPGDLAITLGAGSIWQAGEELLYYLREGVRGAKGAP